ncbi:hypothetical protein BGW80DRAFT_1339123 [Lactifluus volemus]|nr:hypothetical protein BGW80DRAFT_1339123 [Lactifluus volemus]
MNRLHVCLPLAVTCFAWPLDFFSEPFRNRIGSIASLSLSWNHDGDRPTFILAVTPSLGKVIFSAAETRWVVGICCFR